MDLSKRAIKINSHYEITYGRLILAIFIIGFQLLGISCLNNWQIVPEMFFTLSSFFLTLTQQNTILTECEEEEKKR